MITAYELERILRRVAQGTSTVRDAERLRALLSALIVTDTVVAEYPQR